MNITQESTGALSAVLKVKIGPEDYKEKFENALKQYRRQVQLPGFRVGKVPMGIVRNKYGEYLLADEINKLISDSINSFLTENRIDTIGYPIPSDEHEESGDFTNPSDFEFVYELGLRPSFDIDLGNFNYTAYSVEVEQELVDDEVNQLLRRYGKIVDEELSTEDSFLVGEFLEVDADGTEVEGGIRNNENIFIPGVKDESTRKSLCGLKKGDTVQVNVHHISKDHEDLGKILGITHEQVHHLANDQFLFKVSEVKRLEEAELNEALFAKLYPNGDVNSREEMETATRSELEGYFKAEAERYMRYLLPDNLIKAFPLELPDGFLKRYIKHNKNEGVSDEDIESNYGQYANATRWQLMSNHLAKRYGIQVSNEELVDAAKVAIASNFRKYGLNDVPEELLQKSALETLEKKEQREALAEQVFDAKLMGVVLERARVDTKKVTAREFQEIAAGN
jgi:trigger factor